MVRRLMVHIHPIGRAPLPPLCGRGPTRSSLLAVLAFFAQIRARVIARASDTGSGRSRVVLVSKVVCSHVPLGPRIGVFAFSSEKVH